MFLRDSDVNVTEIYSWTVRDVSASACYIRSCRDLAFDRLFIHTLSVYLCLKTNRERQPKKWIENIESKTRTQENTLCGSNDSHDTAEWRRPEVASSSFQWWRRKKERKKEKAVLTKVWWRSIKLSMHMTYTAETTPRPDGRTDSKNTDAVGRHLA